MNAQGCGFASYKHFSLVAELRLPTLRARPRARRRPQAPYSRSTFLGLALQLRDSQDTFDSVSFFIYIVAFEEVTLNYIPGLVVYQATVFVKNYFIIGRLGHNDKLDILEHS